MHVENRVQRGGDEVAVGTSGTVTRRPLPRGDICLRRPGDLPLMALLSALTLARLRRPRCA